MEKHEKRFARRNRMQPKEKQLTRASMTVEAALLTPLLIYMMIGLIYLDFWQYDQVIAEALCCQAAWTVQCGAKEESEVSSQMESLISGNLLMDELTEASCSRNILWSQADCTVLSEIPLAVIRDLLGGIAGYTREHVSVVSNLADVTMFRKLARLEKKME